MISRERTGCITCRNRKVKCDEDKPTCQNCTRSCKRCSWTRDFRFIHHNQIKSNKQTQGFQISPVFSPEKRRRHDSDGSQESEGSFAAPPELESLPVAIATSDRRTSLKPSPPTSSSLAYSPSSESQTVSSSMTSHMPSESSGYATSFDASVTAICRNESDRLQKYIDLEHASPIPPNLNPNPEGFTDWRTLDASEIVQKALNSDLEIQLLHNYIWECAPWFDAQNSERHYSKKDVNRMMNCPPWRAAAMALSAKNIELRNGKATDSDSLSLHLYQLAVKLAIDSISGRFDCVGTLAGCVILSVYEMMTVSYMDWRRHLQGCASIYTHNEWNGSTGGLISASFWDYARIDIWAAFCSETQTLIDPWTWFSDPKEIMALSVVDEDRHAQIATWLLARTVNLVHGSVRRLSSLASDLESLHSDLSKWEEMGNGATRPVILREANSNEDIPFPRILFSSHSSTIGHTMFHTAKVLILELDKSLNAAEISTLSDSLYQHSLITCGIIETNDHNACLVNSLQPIWICSRHLRSRAEKFGSLEILARIEKRTGWRCDWRANSLRELWDLC